MSDHGWLLNPNSRWDTVRGTSVGRLTQARGILDLQVHGYDGSARDVSVNAPPVGLQRPRGGLAGFPTGNASRRDVSRKAREAEQARHRVRARNPDEVGRSARNVSARTQPGDARRASLGQRASTKGRSRAGVAPFLFQSGGMEHDRAIKRSQMRSPPGGPSDAS